MDNCSSDCSRCTATCDDNVVCRCLQVTESTILAAVQKHQLKSIGDLKALTGAGDGCMACHRKLRRLLELQLA